MAPSSVCKTRPWPSLYRHGLYCLNLLGQQQTWWRILFAEGLMCSLIRHLKRNDRANLVRYRSVLIIRIKITDIELQWSDWTIVSHYNTVGYTLIFQKGLPWERQNKDQTIIKHKTHRIAHMCADKLVVFCEFKVKKQIKPQHNGSGKTISNHAATIFFYT